MRRTAIGRLTTIGYGAFEDCSVLDNVVIPAKVTTLGNAIFLNCTNLATLYSEATSAPSCGYLGAPNLQIIYVPIGSGASYRNTAPWSYYYIEEKATKYNLIYTVDGAEYKKTEMEYGAAITAEALPVKEGHTFSGWSEIPETMPAKDVTVTGMFTVNKYEIVYKVDGEVYHKDSIAYGETIVAIEIPVKEGYIFSGWSEVPETMPAEDVEVSGNFEADGIEKIFADKQKVDVYTLQGVKIKEQIEAERLGEELSDGIYIIDGKKVVIKK